MDPVLSTGHQTALLSLPQLLPPSPFNVFTLSVLIRSLTRHSGICGPYRELLFCPLGTMPQEKGRTVITPCWGLQYPLLSPPLCTPTSCLYITLPSASVHPRPDDVFTLFPFFYNP